MRNPKKYQWVNLALVERMFSELDDSGKRVTVLKMMSGEKVRTYETSEVLMRGGSP